MGKIMDNVKHDYNAFLQLQTKFFHKQCVIWSFPPSLKEFHHVSTFSKFQVQVRMKKNVTNKWYFPLSFSNHNETSPKSVITVM